ncbi:MAG: hypothetical protein LC708_00755, partial [Actinobacteria bacterium]|nr:hypothetical protein [Actinomycetota bacterium]
MAQVVPAEAARVSPAPASLKVYPLPGATDYPFDLAVGPDGNLWTASTPGGGAFEPLHLARITTAGVASSVPTEGRAVFPRITSGPDGNLWMFNLYANSVDKLALDGALIARYAIPINGGTGDIAKGPDGNVWVASQSGRLYRVTPTGEVTEFQSPTGGGGAADVTAGPDGNVWFTDPFGNKIGRIVPATGAITEFALPRADQYEGPDQ